MTADLMVLIGALIVLGWAVFHWDDRLPPPAGLTDEKTDPYYPSPESSEDSERVGSAPARNPSPRIRQKIHPEKG